MEITTPRPSHARINGFVWVAVLTVMYGKNDHNAG